MTTFYKKQGRRYIPVSEYDPELLASKTYGNHLVVVRPGVTSQLYNVDPAIVPLIAAGVYAKDTLINALSDASEARPDKTPLTDEQIKAWRAFDKSMGGCRMLQYQSYNMIAQAGIDALIEEADKTLQHPSVKAAWEQFMMVYQLTKQHSEL